MGPVKLICPRRHVDSRGWFTETHNERALARLGVAVRFVQDNLSHSQIRGVLRGLHFQIPPHAQAKLVRCQRGRVWDVAVDLRHGSPTFGRWVGVELSADNGWQLFIPIGFAHGFVTLEEDTELAYKVSAHYEPRCEKGIIWSDATLAVAWPLNGVPPLISEKDARLGPLADFAGAFAYDGQPLSPLPAEPLIP
jgi:dTDP-4-dehydrorhamnose 3,5-epimerase